MANTVAAQLTGEHEASFHPAATATKLKVTGINLFSAGDFAEGEDREEIVLRDAARGVYRRLIIQDNRLIGIVLYGDVSHGAWLFDLLKRGADISEIRETVMFGPGAPGGARLDPTAAVAALPDDAEICGCNGVCKGKIVETINAKGLKNLDEVRAHTKASASCGSCTGLVEQVIQLTLGESYAPAAVTPMCKCTDLGHDDVRRLIVAKQIMNLPEALQSLEWKTSSAAPNAARRSTIISSPPGPANTRTTGSRASSTSAFTPIFRKTAPTASFRACGAASPAPRNCAPSPTSSRNSPFPP
jgi:nitrite reductase (NADH) large subunit